MPVIDQFVDQPDKMSCMLPGPKDSLFPFVDFLLSEVHLSAGNPPILQACYVVLPVELPV